MSILVSRRVTSVDLVQDNMQVIGSMEDRFYGEKGHVKVCIPTLDFLVVGEMVYSVNASGKVHVISIDNYTHDDKCLPETDSPTKIYGVGTALLSVAFNKGTAVGLIAGNSSHAFFLKRGFTCDGSDRQPKYPEVARINKLLAKKRDGYSEALWRAKEILAIEHRCDTDCIDDVFLKRHWFWDDRDQPTFSWRERVLRTLKKEGHTVSLGLQLLTCKRQCKAALHSQ